MNELPSHPWLAFEVDLLGASPLFWLQLGEAQARCSLLAGAGLPPGAAAGIARRAQARGVLALAAEAAGAVDEEEAADLLDGGPPAPRGRRRASRELLATAKACTRVRELAGASGAAGASGTGGLTPELLEELNRIALAVRPAPAGPGAARSRPARAAAGRAAAAQAGGQDRAHDAGALDATADAEPGAPDLDPLRLGLDEAALAHALAGLPPVPPAARAALVAHLCEWLNTPRPGLPLVVATLKAMLAHLYLVWMRPYAAANALTARLAELHVLLQAGLPAAAALLPAAHYARTREEYARQIATSPQVRDGARLFLGYAVGGFAEGLRALHAEVEERQRALAWEAALEEALQGEGAAAAGRQRVLARELARAGGVVPRGRLLELSPALALAYGGLSAKTLARDLERLAEAGLVARGPAGYAARAEVARGLAVPHAAP